MCCRTNLWFRTMHETIHEISLGKKTNVKKGRIKHNARHRRTHDEDDFDWLERCNIGENLYHRGGFWTASKKRRKAKISHPTRSLMLCCVPGKKAALPCAVCRICCTLFFTSRPFIHIFSSVRACNFSFLQSPRTPLTGFRFQLTNFSTLRPVSSCWELETVIYSPPLCTLSCLPFV